MLAAFTNEQGQYLTFIYAYTTLHLRPLAEADFQAVFRVTPDRTLGATGVGPARLHPPLTGHSRSIELLVAPEKLPILRRIDQISCYEVLARS